ncbi:hypothetical protein [Shouchella shacheensis]|uniref:hypothetical protein n=1 Tax=Shouchella shacheensis TaxID=1649580 RepID=UPI000B214F76|nr:hypothetical protein [Shouchella shacheensis]
MWGLFIVIILLVFVFDFSKIRDQNKEMINQNNKIIELLEKMNSNSEKENS